MKKTRLKSISTVALALALFSPPLQSLINPNYEVNANQKETTNNLSQQSIKKFNPQGLMGYYFEDDNFKKTVMIGPERTSLLNVKKGDIISSKDAKIGSAKFLGNIKAKVTGEHTFKTSTNTNIEIKVNGKVVVKDKTSTPIKLEKDKLYNIEISYKPTKNNDSLLDLQLSYSTNNKDFNEVSGEMLYLPDFSAKTKLLTSSEDTDGDSIPNDWELNGYTVDENLNIIQWNDSLAGKYKKYTSNSNKSHTVSDPYSDSEKVLGKMPAATSIEALDPMVAAYPAVGVGMEKLHFSKNENVSEGTSGTQTVSTSTTESNSSTLTIGGSMGGESGVGPQGPSSSFSYSVNGSYSHTWTNSTTHGSDFSNSWSQSIGINTADAAYLNANVRYHNAGNAPIYNAAPTVSFNLKNANTSILTVLSKQDNIANGINPNATYPERNQPAMALTQLTNNGTKMTVDKPTLDKIQDKSEAINLITNQTTGDYGIINNSGQLQTGGSWGPILGDVESSSAGIILSKPGLKEESGNLERRVAVRDYNNSTDKTPEITIGESVKKAFNTTDSSNGMFYYHDPIANKNIYLHESAIHIITDKNTSDEIKKQLDAGTKSIYECKLKRGMNITLNVPKVYYDFESNDTGWTNTILMSGSCSGNSSGKVSSGVEASTKTPLNLKKFTTYKLRGMFRSVDLNANHEIGIKDSDGDVIVSKKFKLNSGWNSIELEFNTGSNPEAFKNMFISSLSDNNNKLYNDEIQLFELNYDSNQDFGNLDTWDWTTKDNTDFNYLSPVSISNVVIPYYATEDKYDYKIVSGETDFGAKPATISDGKLMLNLESYNNGQGIIPSEEIDWENSESTNPQPLDVKIIAIDKNTNVETLIGKWDKTKHYFDRPIFDNTIAGTNGVKLSYPSKSNPQSFNYRIVINNKDKGIVSSTIDTTYKTVYIDFLRVNGGIALHKGDNVKVYAVDTSSKVQDEYLIVDFYRSN